MASEWVKLLTDHRKTNGADVVPDGWHTSKEIAVQLGLCKSSATGMINKWIKAGTVERKTFKIFDGRRVAPMLHYKIISKSTCQPKKTSIQRHD